ncbi:integrase core domain-containing protein [Streptomyces sp. NPDC048419]|uniref:integrase core domain-containing protein n=1 Tax=Streptomyces sp. NPDC048419 TaxID=3365547 RepID=UPI0037199B6A
MAQPTGRVRSALDNAAAESFHSVLKVECIHRHTVAARTGGRLKTATWTAGLCNTSGRHSELGGKPPAEFERIPLEARVRADRVGQAA